MTDRKLTCVACKSAITEGDIAHSDLEFGGEIKATNQPTYTADADTDLVATVGTLDEYSPMVRTTGNQIIYGDKTTTGIILISGNKQFLARLKLRNEAMSRPEYGNLRKETHITFIDKDDNILSALMLVRLPSGLSSLVVRLYDKNGAYHDTTIASYQDTI